MRRKLTETACRLKKAEHALKEAGEQIDQTAGPFPKKPAELCAFVRVSLADRSPMKTRAGNSALRLRQTPSSAAGAWSPCNQDDVGRGELQLSH